MKRIFTFTITAVVLVTLYLISSFIWDWNHEKEVILFIGQGDVVEYQQWTVGLDGGRYYRVNCSPEEVKKHLQDTGLQAYSGGPMKLTEHIANSAIQWPEDIAKFSSDWISYTIAPGYYRIIGYPSDSSDEIVVIEISI